MQNFGLLLSLSGVSCVLLTFSIFYAIFIYHFPFRPGRTWLSVVIGDAATDVGVTLSILISLLFLELLNYWWLALFPFIGHLLTGIPMILFQEVKRSRQNKMNSDIVKEYNGKKK